MHTVGGEQRLLEREEDQVGRDRSPEAGVQVKQRYGFVVDDDPRG